MDKNFTLNDLADFYNQEKEYLNSVFEEKSLTVKKPEVSKKAIKNIQDFSKVLSVKETKSLGKIDFILN